MLSDDVYRSRLSSVIDRLEGWARDARDAADVDTQSAPTYWKMRVSPKQPGACPFELLVLADQRFNLRIADEVFEDKPIDSLDFFPMLVRAIAAGRVARIEIRNAMTGALESVETRVALEDGWAWIGERRITPRSKRTPDGGDVMREHRFLPYSR